MTTSTCANCHQPGNAACKGCLLVVYCGRDCQKAHWAKHKADCKSPLLSSAWTPSWWLARPGPPGEWRLGAKKGLWSQMPALDIVQLPTNEGGEYDRDLRLLLAASGDLGSVVKTLASLPQNYAQPISLVINDQDMDVVARNVIMLLVALAVPDDAQAATSMLHIWYSSLIRQSDADVLATVVLPMVKDVVREVAHKAPNAVHEKVWEIGENVCRLEMVKEKWVSLLSYIKKPATLSAKHAQRLRRQVALSPVRKDVREQYMFRQIPAVRACAKKYAEDGLLLPFGSDNSEFTVPNPTLFRNGDWPFEDYADPLDGWDLAEITQVKAGPATNDIYGKLFQHVHDLVLGFRRRLATNKVEFHLFHMDAADLPRRLDGESFDRIEVSNLSDGAYLGVERTVASMGPLLRRPRDNPCATLLLLFLDAVEEEVAQGAGNSGGMSRTADASRFVMRDCNPDELLQPRLFLIQPASALLRDMDWFFDRYMARLDFAGVEERSAAVAPGGLRIKEQNTVVDKWPLRFKMQNGQRGAQGAFEILLSSSHGGHERYVEWQRKP